MRISVFFLNRIQCVKIDFDDLGKRWNNHHEKTFKNNHYTDCLEPGIHGKKLFWMPRACINHDSKSILGTTACWCYFYGNYKVLSKTPEGSRSAFIFRRSILGVRPSVVVRPSVTSVDSRPSSVRRRRPVVVRHPSVVGFRSPSSSSSVRPNPSVVVRHVVVASVNAVC